MLSFESLREFVSTKEMCWSASITQQSKRTSFLFLYKISQINKREKKQANFQVLLNVLCQDCS